LALHVFFPQRVDLVADGLTHLHQQLVQLVDACVDLLVHPGKALRRRCRGVVSIVRSL